MSVSDNNFIVFSLAQSSSTNDSIPNSYSFQRKEKKIEYKIRSFPFILNCNIISKYLKFFMRWQIECLVKL
jgi:hypothetical protein